MTDKTELAQLRRTGAIGNLSSGMEGIKITLMVQDLPKMTRVDLRKALTERFALVAKDISTLGGEVDLKSISVAAKTTNAILPIDNYQDIVRALEKQKIRVDVSREYLLT